MWIRAAIIAAMLAAMTACGGTAQQQSPAGAPAAPPAAGLPKADLTFTSPTLDGGTFSGASLAGKPAVLWFWEPWCTSCPAEAPAVLSLTAKHGDRLGVLGVVGRNDPDSIRDFVSSTGTDGLTHLLDERGGMRMKFGMKDPSGFVLITARGEVAYRGFLDERQLDAQVNRLVAG